MAQCILTIITLFLFCPNLLSAYLVNGPVDVHILIDYKINFETKKKILFNEDGQNFDDSPKFNILSKIGLTDSVQNEMAVKVSQIGYKRVRGDCGKTAEDYPGYEMVLVMEDGKYGGSRDRENLMYHDYEHSDYGRSDSAGNVEQQSTKHCSILDSRQMLKWIPGNLSNDDLTAAWAEGTTLNYNISEEDKYTTAFPFGELDHQVRVSLTGDRPGEKFFKKRKAGLLSNLDLNHRHLREDNDMKRELLIISFANLTEYGNNLEETENSDHINLRFSPRSNRLRRETNQVSDKFCRIDRDKENKITFIFCDQDGFKIQGSSSNKEGSGSNKADHSASEKLVGASWYEETWLSKYYEKLNNIKTKIKNGGKGHDGDIEAVLVDRDIVTYVVKLSVVIILGILAAILLLIAATMLLTICVNRCLRNRHKSTATRVYKSKCLSEFQIKDDSHIDTLPKDSSFHTILGKRRDQNDRVNSAPGGSSNCVRSVSHNLLSRNPSSSMPNPVNQSSALEQLDKQAQGFSYINPECLEFTQKVLNSRNSTDTKFTHIGDSTPPYSTSYHQFMHCGPPISQTVQSIQYHPMGVGVEEIHGGPVGHAFIRSRENSQNMQVPTGAANISSTFNPREDNHHLDPNINENSSAGPSSSTFKLTIPKQLQNDPGHTYNKESGFYHNYNYQTRTFRGNTELITELLKQQDKIEMSLGGGSRDVKEDDKND